MKSAAHVLGLFLVGAGASQCVLAQESVDSSGPLQLALLSNSARDELFIIGRREGSLTVPGVEAAKRTLEDIPGSVSLVPAESFEQSYVLNIKDMLALTPGVYAQRRWAEEVRLSIRGSGISRSFHLRGVELLQDGVPINLADGSGDFQEVDPLVQRYVEVYKGGNGLRYGASSLGGAINFVTPTGYTTAANRTVRLEAGSFGTSRLHGALADVIGNWDVYAGATGVYSEGFRDQSRQASGRLSSNLGYRFSDRAETRFYLGYNHINQEVPGTLSLDDALNRPETAPAVNQLNDYARDIRSLRISNKTTWLTDSGRLEAGAYANDRELYHPIFQVVDQDSLDYGAFARWTVENELAGRRSIWTLGANLKAGDVDALRFVNVRGGRGAKTADADQETVNIDVHAENQTWLWDSFAVSLGAQALRSEREYRDNLNPAASAEKTFSGVSPTAGVLWQLRPDAQLFANITRSREVPTYSELVQAPLVGFVPLDAQTAWTAELGTRGGGNRLHWDITLYRSKVEGELLQYTVNPDFPASTFNAGDTLHQGVELGVDVQLLPGTSSGTTLLLRQVYTFNDFSFEDDPQYGDNTLPGIPGHVLRTELRLAHPSGWHVAPVLEWVPEGAYVDYANTRRAPSYAVLGLSVGWDVSKQTSVYLDARNITDESYVSSFGTMIDAGVGNASVFYPGEPRAVFGGVKFSF